MQTTMAIATALLLAGQTSGDATPRANVAHLRHCVISLIDHVQVPAEEEGVITGVPVQQGSMVQLGDILAQLDDTEAQMRLVAAQHDLKIANKKATDQVPIKAAAAQWDVAKLEVLESKEINIGSPGAVPETQIRREEMTATVRGLQVEMAKSEYDIAGLEKDVKVIQVDAVNAEIKRRKIDAPHGGVVVQVYKHVGEWCRAGDPILRMVRMDKLRVEGFVNAAEYLPQEIANQPVKISIKLPRGQVVTLNATIGYYSPIVEASGEYRVWAEVENKQAGGFWLLRPGLNAEMEIDVRPATLSSTALAPARP